MSKHEDIEFELSQLLDSELPQERAAELRNRLDADPKLAEEFRIYQELEGRLAQLGQDVPNVDWDLQRESIRATLERDALLGPMPSMWPMRVMRWTAGAAAVAAAVVAVAMLWPMLRPSTGPARLDVALVGPPTTPAGAIVLVGQVLGPPELAQQCTLEVAVREPQASSLGNVSVRPTCRKEGLAGTIVVSAGQTPSQARADSAASWLLADL